VTSPREAFLHRVRQAVVEGNRAGGTPPLPERGSVGYQGAGPDLLARLHEELTSAGTHLHIVPDADRAAAVVRRIVAEKDANKVLVGDGVLLDLLDLKSKLHEVEVVRIDSLPEVKDREAFFSADVGITGVEAVIAETGTIVLETRRDQPRSLSLLVPVHIAVALRDQFLADLFDLFPKERTVPACLSLITGPSKTGDIELRLVTGVHGPGEVHLIVIETPATPGGTGVPGHVD
jgi:L-lactate dehydrogenase complex protein LldG